MSPANPLLLAPTRPLPHRVGVLGAGTIGPDIAYYLASAIPDLETVLVDIDPDQLKTARTRIEAYVDKGIARGKLSEEQAATVVGGLTTTVDYDDLEGSELVVEAVTEDLELKRVLFARVEALVGEEAIITSNTSALPAGWLFDDMARPQRCTVTHFFAPAFRNPIVEIVRWDGAHPGMIDYLRWVFAITGKVPIVTADVPCFMLDRVFDNWCNEAGHLLSFATAAQIDSVAEEFVHAGPFYVLNLAHGNPLITETNTLQMQEEGEQYRPSPVFASVGEWTTSTPGSGVDVPDEIAWKVRDRLLGIVFSQTVDILDRGIGDPSDLELGCELALGFKKGPLRLMDEMGEEEVSRILGRIAGERTGMPMPGRALHDYQDFRKNLLVDDHGGVKVITLRRPGALNALDDEVNAELLETLEEEGRDPAVKGFIITGYGTRAFSAGADIGRFVEFLGDREASTQYARDCSAVLRHLDSTSKPVVAALNGMALGGGLELALRCHGIVAMRDAWMQLPEVTLGIAPGIGGLVIPYRRWPEAGSVFHQMLREARRLDAEEAHRLGVVDEVVDDHAALIERAAALAMALAGRLEGPSAEPVEIPPFPDIDTGVLDDRGISGEVVAIIERAIHEAAAASGLEDALEVGYAAFAETACTGVAREKITAFAAGRRG